MPSRSRTSCVLVMIVMIVIPVNTQISLGAMTKGTGTLGHKPVYFCATVAGPVLDTHISFPFLQVIPSIISPPSLCQPQTCIWTRAF